MNSSWWTHPTKLRRRCNKKEMITSSKNKTDHTSWYRKQYFVSIPFLLITHLSLFVRYHLLFMKDPAIDRTIHRHIHSLQKNNKNQQRRRVKIRQQKEARTRRDMTWNENIGSSRRIRLTSTAPDRAEDPLEWHLTDSRGMPLSTYGVLLRFGYEYNNTGKVSLPNGSSS